MNGKTMTADEVRERLVARWPDDRYLHVYEAPTDSARQGSKIDVLVLSLWNSDKHEIDAVEVKVSYSDWCKEWRRTEWRLTSHEGEVHTFHRKPNSYDRDRYTGGTYEADLTNRYLVSRGRLPVPDDFVPPIERSTVVDVSKNQDWRARAHRFWVAAPAALAVKIVEDVRCHPEMDGWGVLAVGETSVHVLLTPTRREHVIPFSHQQWLGIVRTAADSGLQALDRARRAGYRQAEEDAKARAFREAQRAAIAEMSLPL